eukprot:Gb_31987 [translate_table: standard]
MIGGTVLQTLILMFITCRTDWNREALEAGDRIKVWGGSVEAIKDGSEKEKEGSVRKSLPSNV